MSMRSNPKAKPSRLVATYAVGRLEWTNWELHRVPFWEPEEIFLAVECVGSGPTLVIAHGGIGGLKRRRLRAVLL